MSLQIFTSQSQKPQWIGMRMWIWLSILNNNILNVESARFLTCCFFYKNLDSHPKPWHTIKCLCSPLDNGGQCAWSKTLGETIWDNSWKGHFGADLYLFISSLYLQNYFVFICLCHSNQRGSGCDKNMQKILESLKMPPAASIVVATKVATRWWQPRWQLEGGN